MTSAFNMASSLVAMINIDCLLLLSFNKFKVSIKRNILSNPKANPTAGVGAPPRNSTNISYLPPAHIVA
ncbi:Uncharacterised protein [Legionella pneumophila]|nr:Uncharacterised protein [Legionella pneumophila]